MHLPHVPSAAPVARRLLLAAAAILAVGCDEGESASLQTLEDVVAFGPTIELEESDDVINVTPAVTLDPRGGFLVADEREGQLRRYGASGALLWHAGRMGSGPGEFRSLAMALRLPDGSVLAAERSGSFTLFDSAGTTAGERIRNPFMLVEDMDVVNDSTVLVAARLEGRRGTGPGLHLWDLRTRRVRSSFFDPLAAAPNQTAAIIAGWSKASVRGDSVAAIFALSDTIYRFTLDGRPIDKRPIPFAHFRAVPRENPSGAVDPVRRAQFLSSFDYVADVHWLPDGRILVPYQSVLADRALTRAHHLFAMDAAGKRLFEVQDVPRLLAVVPQSQRLLFISPDAEAPNQWTFAELR